MASEWIMVRIEKRVRDRLESIRQSMLLASEIGAKPLQLDDRDRLSLSRVVELLCDMREGHAERRRRASKRRRRRPVEPAAEPARTNQETTEVFRVQERGPESIDVGS